MKHEVPCLGGLFACPHVHCPVEHHAIVFAFRLSVELHHGGPVVQYDVDTLMFGAAHLHTSHERHP